MSVVFEAFSFLFLLAGLYVVVISMPPMIYWLMDSAAKRRESGEKEVTVVVVYDKLAPTQVHVTEHHHYHDNRSVTVQAGDEAGVQRAVTLLAGEQKRQLSKREVEAERQRALLGVRR